jgi:hypothetical protein
MYRDATTYLADGTASARSRDLRAAAAVRVGWRGLLVVGEVLRKQVTDDLSMRPDVMTRSYLQANWWIPFGKGQGRISPLVRAGLLEVRELTAPASGRSLELGVAAYPMANGRLRLVGVYRGYLDPDLGPSHGGIIQARVVF